MWNVIWAVAIVLRSGQSATTTVDAYLASQSTTATTLRTQELSGTIPNTIATFTSLTTIEWNTGGITGVVPSLAALPLRTLWIVNNGLTGNFNFLNGLTNMVNLSLSKNNFQNVGFPAAVLQMTKLAYLDLSFNFLTGSVPSLAGLTMLKSLNITSNKFRITPSDLVLPTLLEELEMSSNTIATSLPAQLAMLPSLRRVLIKSSKMTGTIPSTLGDVSSLTFVDLSTNKFVGPIPSSLGALANLDTLVLSGNLLTGTYPKGVVNPKLTKLSLFGNCFSGPLPPFASMPKLSIVDVSSNSFSGTIPTNVVTIPGLAYLILTANNLIGTLPDFSGATALRAVAVANNMLNGTAPVIPGVQVVWGTQRQTYAIPKSGCPIPTTPITTTPTANTTATATANTTATAKPNTTSTAPHTTPAQPTKATGSAAQLRVGLLVVTAWVALML